MKPQIVEMSDAEYHNDPHDLPSLSASIAHMLTSKSAAHAYEAHPKLGGRPFEPSSEMDFGSLCHAVLIGAGGERIKTVRAATDLHTGSGAKKQLRYMAGEAFTDWKMGAAQDARDEIRAAGNIPVLQRDIDAAQTLAIAARRQFKPEWLIASPEQHRREAVLLWHETARNGMSVPCRAKLDLLSVERGLIEDLKCPDSAHPKKVAKHVETYGSHVQYAAYVSALGAIVPALVGRVRYSWVFCETSRPYCVLRRHPAGSLRQLGEALWLTAVNRWAECLDSDRWPGYDDEDRGIEASHFAMQELIESELEEGEAA